MDPRDALQVLTTRDAYRAHVDAVRARGERVAFVPTMGALHQGHLHLMQVAREHVGPSGCVVVSIFVNPTQFGPNEDLARYPRELDADVARCASVGVDAVFAPSVEEMYPQGEQTRVHVSSLTEPMCGVFRPGHFEGVATVVTKLFALTGPCTALFGRKDFQQLRVITQLARDLFLPVTVIGVPTVRESDGLALSSRNRYLSPADRERARVIPHSLAQALTRWSQGERDIQSIRDAVWSALEARTDRVEYVEARNAETLQNVSDVSLASSQTRVVLAIATRVGNTRLIDNVVLGEDTITLQQTAPPTT